MPETGGHRCLPGRLLDRSPTRRTSPEGLGRPGHAIKLGLAADELASIGDGFPPGVVAGDRYADMNLLNC
jgi:hypothetical protein